MKDQLRECIRQIEADIENHIDLPQGRNEELHQRCVEAIQCLRMTRSIWILAGCTTHYLSILDHVLEAARKRPEDPEAIQRIDHSVDVIIECMIWELAEAFDQSRK